MKVDPLHSLAFWMWAAISAACLSVFFAWEIGLIPALPSPPRPEPSTVELVFTVLLILLLSSNAGLLRWQSKFGDCPIGSKRATGIGGALGAMALLCPVCLLLPVSLFGISLSLAFLSPFIPLLQIIAVFLLCMSGVLLWPKKSKANS